MRPDRTPFDAWLSRALHAGHDAVIAEPMPDEWLRLVLEHPRPEHAPDLDRAMIAGGHAAPTAGRWPG